VTSQHVPNWDVRKPIKEQECEVPGDWAIEARCAESDDPMWITKPTKKTGKHQRVLAERVCGVCPVRRQCLEWALTGGDFEGVAAGLLWPSGGACHSGHHPARPDEWCAGCRGRE
jgi:hypothetical protein